jgi:UDP-glucose-4-epimerase GalE
MVKAILVTGGAGYIGSHTCKLLDAAGYVPITFDNLTAGHADAVRWGPLIVGDLHDTELLIQVLDEYKPLAVVHFAGSAYVGESVLQPLKYYRNNVGATLSLLEAMQIAGVKNFVFSSTCATYGIPDQNFIGEDCLQDPINPYGKSKLMIERILEDLASQGVVNQISLRYFNAAGDDRDGEIGERHNPETHLIPLAIDSALGGKKLKIFGTDFPTPDGTAVRDFIHVEDLGRAHILAVDHLLSGDTETNVGSTSTSSQGVSYFINLGTGIGCSVKEIIYSLRDLGIDVQAIDAPKRIGDPPFLVANANRAKEILGWMPEYADIKSILQTAVKWHLRHRQNQSLILESKKNNAVSLLYEKGVKSFAQGISGFVSQHGIEFVKYFSASATALVFDYASYWLLLEFIGLSQPISASIGYVIGMVVAYFLLVTHVFYDGWLKQKKHYEVFLFVITGAVGVACTYTTVLSYSFFLAEKSHFAKIMAIAVSFIVVYLLRKYLVFRR